MDVVVDSDQIRVAIDEAVNALQAAVLWRPKSRLSNGTCVARSIARPERSLPSP
jgi:hypothetical protein